MKAVFNSIVLIALIPLIALALEPTNPPGVCDRFVNEKDADQCRARTQKEDNVDWYAATVCNLQKEDGSFWKCWDSIQDQAFNPQSLDKCGEEKELSDAQRQECVNNARGGRTPASANQNFQALRISKPTK